LTIQSDSLTFFFTVTLGSPEAKKAKEKQAEEMDDNKISDESITVRCSVDLETPPPPQISNPSPPPPPRIFAVDLKKIKKKREKSDDKSLEAKRKRLAKGISVTYMVITKSILVIVALHFCDYFIYCVEISVHAIL